MKKHPLYLLMLFMLIFSTPGNGKAQPVVFTADNDYITYSGSLNGTTYQHTLKSDNNYQVITESRNGWPFYQTLLKHSWKFDIKPGDTITFYIEARCDRKEDFFDIYYFTDPNHIVLNRILTISEKEDTLMSANLPSDISGPLYIFIEDTDKSWWHRNKDSVYIDYMAVESISRSPSDGMPISTTIHSPYPENEATTVYKKPTFQWEADEEDVSFGIYVTSDEKKIAQMHPEDTDNIIDFISETDEYYYEGIYEKAFDFPEMLTTNTWYYWRILSVDHSENRDLGPVWKFFVPGLLRSTEYQIPDGIEPVGGGKGYVDIINPDDCTAPSCMLLDYSTLPYPYDDSLFETSLQKVMIVYDRETLIDALDKRSNPGDIVYIKDVDENGEQTRIDMTPVLFYDSYGTLDKELSEIKQLVIPRGVTLASGRGKGGNKGAMIYQSIPKESESPHGEFQSDESNDTGYDERYFSDGLMTGGLIIIPGEGKSGYSEPLHPSGENEKLDFEGVPITRITGLQIKGPRMFYEPAYDQKALATGKRKLLSDFDAVGSRGIMAYNNVIIDNCDISHFSYGAVNLMKTPDIRQQVHHNYIHQTGGSLGYGIEMGEAYPVIYANYFNLNRHAIAGIGVNKYNAGNCSYEASYNIVLEGVTTEDFSLHAFDMHGTLDFNIFWMSSRAGHIIRIYRNTFSWFKNNGTANGPNPLNTPVISIRGVPYYNSNSHCEIFDNWFLDPNISHAVRQKYNHGRMTVYDNKIGVGMTDQSAWNHSYWD